MRRRRRVLLAVGALAAASGVADPLAADAHLAGGAVGPRRVRVGVLQLGPLLVAGAFARLAHAGASLCGSLAPSFAAPSSVSSGSVIAWGTTSFAGALPRPVRSGTTGCGSYSASSTASTPPGGGSAGSISGVGCSPKSITMRCSPLPHAASCGAPRSEPERRVARHTRTQPLQNESLVRDDRVGEPVEGEPLECGGLGGLDDARLTDPGAGGEEEVDPLVDRCGMARALHGGDELQHEGVDADLLARLAVRGVVRRLAALDVACCRRGPVPVHVAGVLPELEQHLCRRARGAAGAQQEHVRRRDDPEAIGHVHPGPAQAQWATTSCTSWTT